MQCEDAQKLNNDFIAGKIEAKKLNEYIKHIEGCRDCYEELDIMFIVTHGIEEIRSDSDSCFNFPSMLSRRIGEAKLYLKIKRKRDKVAAVLSLAAYSLLSFVLIVFFTSL